MWYSIKFNVMDIEYNIGAIVLLNLLNDLGK